MAPAQYDDDADVVEYEVAASDKAVAAALELLFKLSFSSCKRRNSNSALLLLEWVVIELERG